MNPAIAVGILFGAAAAVAHKRGKRRAHESGFNLGRMEGGKDRAKGGKPPAPKVTAKRKRTVKIDAQAGDTPPPPPKKDDE